MILEKKLKTMYIWIYILIYGIEARSSKALPMFYVELKPDNNKDIYEIRLLFNCKIKFEPPHPKQEILQCIDYQYYGHIKSFRKTKCIKCAKDHSTSNSPRINLRISNTCCAKASTQLITKVVWSIKIYEKDFSLYYEEK